MTKESRFQASHFAKACKLSTYSVASVLAALNMSTSVSLAQTGTLTMALEEITVTARKREEGLQDTPISIAAFTTSGLEAHNITSVDQIGEFTPNLVFDKVSPVGGSNSSAVVYIRGIGQDTGIPTIDLGVGLYVDGVYLARAVGGVVDLVDVERVEVLRGPQGTLFGRNTIGGAISITSEKPHDELSGYVAGTVGDDQRIDVKGSINLPITDKLFTKFNIASLNRDGYVKRADGVDLGNENALTGRFAARLLASDDFEINLALDGTRRRENGAPYTLVEVDESSMFTSFHNGVLVGPPCVPAPGSTSNPACFNSQWVPTDPTQSYGTAPAYDDTDIWGVALTMDWDATDWLSVKSITSYRNTESEFSIDQDHSPITIAQVLTIFEHEQFSQEIQFQGRAINDRLNWIVGLYYFTEQADSLESVTFSVVDFQSGGSIDNDSLAAFTQTTFDVTDKLSITGGLRYTKDTKKFTPDQFVKSSFIGIPPGVPLLPSTEAEIDVEEVTPMANIAYRWNDDFMTYVTYSEGFKSGGFTQRVFPPLAEAPSFKPEFVEVWEAGFKLSGFDNRMRLNGAVFTTNYTDLQFVVQDVTVAPVVRNAGAAEVDGFELEFLAIPANGWTIEAGLGYLDNKVTEVDPGTGVLPGNSLVRAPEWSLNGGISYQYLMGNAGTLTPRVDWSYRSGVYYDAINSPQIYQPGYHLLSAGITYESADEKWLVSLIGKNLTGERYIRSGFSDPVNLGTSEVVYSRKAEWALSIRRKF